MPVADRRVLGIHVIPVAAVEADEGADRPGGMKPPADEAQGRARV